MKKRKAADTPQDRLRPQPVAINANVEVKKGIVRLVFTSTFDVRI
jgi:hypothetical protein